MYKRLSLPYLVAALMPVAVIPGIALSADIAMDVAVKKAILYSDGAHVTRKGKTAVPTGESSLIIQIPETPINRKTVAVDVTGADVIAFKDKTRVRCRKTAEIDNVTTSRLALMANLMSGRQTESGESYDLHACTVSVPISAKVSGSIDVDLSYEMLIAGWRNIYTAELGQEERTLTLRQEARIWQLSNENWQNVDVTLSWESIRQPTANQLHDTASVNMPVGDQKTSEYQASSNTLQSRAVPPTRAHEAYRRVKQRQHSLNSISLNVGRLFGKGEIQNVVIDTFSIPAKLGAEVRPGKPAVLMVHGEYQGNNDLPPGLVAIENAGQYHSTNRIGKLSKGEQLNLVLGKDERISCEYVNAPVSDLYEAQLQHGAYQVGIRVENNHSVPVETELIETLAIPLAQSHGVVIESDLSFTREGQLDEQLVWYDELGASSDKIYSYAVSLKQ